MILMLEKISVKTTSAIFLLCVVVLCACVNPVDIDKFFKDPDVHKAVEASKAKVNIHKDSENFKFLIAGNEMITGSGLIIGKYYRIEEYDKNEVFKRNLYIKADGTSLGNLAQIGSLSVQKITGLTNFYTYKVTSAQPFDDGTYYYFAFDDPGPNPREATTVNGLVKIPGVKNFYLDLSPVIDAAKDYEVMMIPKSETWGDSFCTSAYYNGRAGDSVSGAGGIFEKYNKTKTIGIYQYRKSLSTTGGIALENRSIIALSGVNTQSDYVFVEYDDDENLTGFTVLSVKRLGEIKFDVTLTYSSGDLSPQIIPPSPASQNSDGQITVEVTNDIYSSYKWFVDGVEQAETSKIFTFDMSDIYNKMVGLYLITVEGKINGIPYSTTVKITVTE
jgi:hypothetical protein